MSDISTWSSTAATNNTASPDGFPESMAPSGVNNSAREVMAAVRRQHEDAQWINYGHTPTFASTTTFTVPGDVTATYDVERRIRLTDATTLYGRISASSYLSPNTTVTVVLDSGNLSSSLSAVAVGIISGSNSAISRFTLAEATKLAGIESSATADQTGAEIKAAYEAEADTNAFTDAFQTKLNALSETGQGHFFGLGTSLASDADHDVTIAVGECAAEGTNTLIELSSAITKQIDAAWTAGNDAGGFPSSITIANDTGYYVFVIRHTDGTVDAGVDISSTATNLLADATGYTTYRQVGYVLTDGSANIATYLRRGDNYYWMDQSASGTSIDFANIPAGITRITVSLSGVSTNGTSNPVIRLGDSGGFETSGYAGALSTLTSSLFTGNISVGFNIGTSNVAANVFHGSLIFTLVDSAANTWAASGAVSLSNSAATRLLAGTKSLSSQLTQIQLTTEGGTDTFDAGTVNIRYE